MVVWVPITDAPVYIRKGGEGGWGECGTRNVISTKEDEELCFCYKKTRLTYECLCDERVKGIYQCFYY